MQSNNIQADYILGCSKEETNRLRLQARLYDPITRQFFIQSGIKPGMRVLDLGCGAGDVSMLAAELVGNKGEVVAVDCNSEILGVAKTRAVINRFSNIKFVHRDICELQPEGIFDAIVGRLILIYLKNPSEHIQRIIKNLKPEGIVAFEELAITSLTLPECEYIKFGAKCAEETFYQAGLNFRIGFQLSRIFEDSQLPPPHIIFSAPAGCRSDWDGYAFMAETTKSILPIAYKTGIASEEDFGRPDAIESRIRDEAQHHQAIVVLAAHMCAWTNKHADNTMDYKTLL